MIVSLRYSNILGDTISAALPCQCKWPVHATHVCGIAKCYSSSTETDSSNVVSAGSRSQLAKPMLEVNTATFDLKSEEGEQFKVSGTSSHLFPVRLRDSKGR